jgi:hypothetical protein
VPELIVIVIVVAMPTMLDNHNLLCVMSAPVTIAVMVAIVVAITLYDNRVLGIRQSVRKSERRNAKSYNSQNKISHFLSSQGWVSSHYQV